MKQAVQNYMTQLPQTVGANASIEKAKQMMEDLSCHHLPVLDGGQLVGVISLKDLNLVMLTSKGIKTPVKDVMTTEPVVVGPQDLVPAVSKRMLDEGINSVIVRAQDKSPWGIFTSHDALKYIVQL
jgi:acetoin utilization protein AcuB